MHFGSGEKDLKSALAYVGMVVFCSMDHDH